ncbi:MAG: hypothetical protein JNL70_28325 [Saprospiraceae bacterium]|nr:hypothetical protein [Saprospiraceae bacterium]
MAKKTKKQQPIVAKTLNLPGKEITGCVHIVENGKVPPKGVDRGGDKYIDTSDRDTFKGRFQPQNDIFINTDAEFDALFDKHTIIKDKNNQEIMFYVKDENNLNPKSSGGTDGWMAYDANFIQNNEGYFFVLQRKFYDGRFPDTYPADGFKKVLHKDIITHLGRHNDSSLCILVSIRDVDGNIINDDGVGGDPPGVGTKVPPPPGE